MKNMHKLLLIPVALMSFACNRDDSKKVDDALNNDLSLASQARPYTPLDSLSAAERASATAQAAYAPTRAGVSSAPTRTVRHTYSSGGTRSSGSSSSGTVYRSGPVDRVEKHPGRDAAIGAGAGAVIGVATSKNKVKGGLIGAAAGGLLGAIIGNNVDKKKVPVQ